MRGVVWLMFSWYVHVFGTTSLLYSNCALFFSPTCNASVKRTSFRIARAICNRIHVTWPIPFGDYWYFIVLRFTPAEYHIADMIYLLFRVKVSIYRVFRRKVAPSDRYAVENGFEWSISRFINEGNASDKMSHLFVPKYKVHTYHHALHQRYTRRVSCLQLAQGHVAQSPGM